MDTETKGKVVHLFSQFMARVAKFDELAAAGNTFLVSFRQGLEFIRRPSIENTSELFEKVIKANNTHRMQSYIKAGYAHTSVRAENLNKSYDIIYASSCVVFHPEYLCGSHYDGLTFVLVSVFGDVRTEVNTSHIQLLNITSKAKDIISELECLVEDVRMAIEAASETIQDFDHDLDPESSTSSEEEIVSFVPKKPEDIDYATMVAVVYSMVKQDYVMQERIVSALNLKTSSGELESYCLMWSLRPFVNDEIMHQAWRLIS
ncbi:hypothetical protein CTI12_AA114860 [Artemisia annua]|uniref:DUF7795 domain-containing protein n=1 Tax=Artemisia annua TaxID=35608 RepID=A0A2U1PTU0_ARTAN|nr:hypothetical protein CTI12_AA114860 [Artemisia annua]